MYIEVMSNQACLNAALLELGEQLEIASVLTFSVFFDLTPRIDGSRVSEKYTSTQRSHLVISPEDFGGIQQTP